MQAANKEAILKYLQDLTEVALKHGIIMGQDLATISQTPDMGLQIGWDVTTQEYVAVDSTGEYRNSTSINVSDDTDTETP